MVFIKRIFAVLAVLAIAAIIFLGFGYWMSGRVPKWYRPRMTHEQLEAAANKAAHKITLALDFIEPVNRPGQPATSQAAVPQARSITFKEDEINAFILRWGELYQDEYEKYVTGPQFTLKEGQIIFSGNVTAMGKFGSLFIEPSINDKGDLVLDISSIHAGMLPVPESMISNHVAPLIKLMEQWLPQWQKRAVIDAAGANSDAVKATMAELLLHTLRHEPAAPLLFVYSMADHSRRIPVRVTEIAVNEGSITLAFRRLSVEERSQLQQRITTPLQATLETH